MTSYLPSTSSFDNHNSHKTQAVLRTVQTAMVTPPRSLRSSPEPNQFTGHENFDQIFTGVSASQNQFSSIELPSFMSLMSSVTPLETDVGGANRLSDAARKRHESLPMSEAFDDALPPIPSAGPFMMDLPFNPIQEAKPETFPFIDQHQHYVSNDSLYHPEPTGFTLIRDSYIQQDSIHPYYVPHSIERPSSTPVFFDGMQKLQEIAKKESRRRTQSSQDMLMAAEIINERGEKRYKCPKQYCSKTYKNINGLKYHLEIGNCEMECKGSDLMNQSELKENSAIRLVQKPFVCHAPGCGKRYKNLNGLKYHAGVAHPYIKFDDVKGDSC